MSDVNININVLARGAEKSVTGLARGANKADKSFKALNISIKQGTSAFKVFLGNVAARGVARVFGAITSSIAGFVSQGIKTNQQLETLSTQFEVLTGSVGEANKITKELVEFAAATPFRFEGIAKAATRLLSFGFTADEVTDRLQDLGDVAGASGADLSELSLIFGQVRAAGQLTGERLLQFQERAIPIGPALAKSLGVAESSIKQLVSEGKVSFDEFEKAFRSLNEEGEFAFGGLEKRSITLAGRISTLDESIELFGAAVTDRLTPALKAGATALTAFFDDLAKDEEFQGFLDQVANNIPSAIRFLGDVLVGLVQVFNGLRTTVNTIRAGFNALAVGVIDSVLAMGSAINVLALAIPGLNVVTTLTTQVDALKTLKSSLEEVAVESIEANDGIAKSQKVLTDTINNGVSIIVTKYNEEKKAAEDRANTTVESNDDIIDSEKNKNAQINLFAAAAAQSAITRREEEKATKQFEAEEDFQFLQTNLAEGEAARVGAQAIKLQNEGKTEAAIKILGDAGVKAKANQVKEKAKLDKEREADQKSSLSTIATLQSSNNKTLATIGKAAALTQLAISGPVAVGRAFEAFPPPFSFIAAAAVATAIAAQVAKVAGVSFQEGGIVGGSSFTGDKVQARVNSGEMILNKQQQAQLFQQANGGGGGGREIIVNSTIELDGEVVGRSVSRQVADGLELGEVV